MKSKYTDADVWLSAALKAIGGLTQPTNGGSDIAVQNVVDVAARVADKTLLAFRKREAELDASPVTIEDENGGEENPKKGKK